MISLRRLGEALTPWNTRGAAREAPRPELATTRANNSNRRRLSFTVDLEPGFGHDRVHVTLTAPVLPRGITNMQFAEHVVRREGGEPEMTDTVIVGGVGGVVVSLDMGETWTAHPIAGLEHFRVRAAFTTRAGLHLLQEEEQPGAGDNLRLAVCDADWNLLDLSPLSSAPWHESRAIDEAGDVIMFAEYPGNYLRDTPNEPDQAWDHDKDSRVFRSRDGGRSWEVAFRVSWRDIRHFHTIMADPFVPHCWWLSSGDTWTDCRVWRSDDDGDTWTDLTHDNPPYPAPKAFQAKRQAAYRFTDAVIMEDGLLWGSDDWLGGRAGWNDPDSNPGERGGSRIFWAPRGEPLMPEVVAYVGCPIRSMIDVGPAWLVLTEAKHPKMIPGAQVCLLSKARPMTLQQIYLAGIHDGRKSGFSYSVSSPRLHKGRMFTQRGSSDVFDGGPRVLQWDVRFE